MDRYFKPKIDPRHIFTQKMTESESESESLFAAPSQQAFCKYSTLRQTQKH